MLYMASVPMGICYLSWFAALRKLSPSTAALATLLTPLVGVLSAAGAFGEPLGFREVLEPFRKELESRESLVIPWTAPDSEVPHVEAGTSSDGRPARLALRE